MNELKCTGKQHNGQNPEPKALKQLLACVFELDQPVHQTRQVATDNH